MWQVYTDKELHLLSEKVYTHINMILQCILANTLSISNTSYNGNFSQGNNYTETVTYPLVKRSCET